MDQELEQVRKCTKRTNLYFDKQINYPWLRRRFLSRKGPEWKRERKKKKSDANVNRKFGIMKWSQILEKDGKQIFCHEGWAKVFSPHAPGKRFFFFSFFERQ